MSPLTRITPRFQLFLAFGVFLQRTACDMHVDKRQANYVKARTDVKVLLTSLEIYRQKNGGLPKSLEELAQGDPLIRKLDFTAYRYSSAGFAAADGGLWLIWTPDPKKGPASDRWPTSDRDQLHHEAQGKRAEMRRSQFMPPIEPRQS